MELALKQVAEIFRVSEKQIIQWVTDDGMPAEFVANQYRFHRADLLEWAALQNREFSPKIYANVNGDLTPAGTHLADALQAGGILPDVGGSDLREVFLAAVKGLPLPPTMSAETVVELLLSRERLGSTAVGKGIAVPHPRLPVLLTVPTSLVRLVYLRQPLDICTPDGIPVDKLFMMICATSKEHLQLLARLSALLRDDEVCDALNNRQTGEQLFETLRQVGKRFHEAELS